MKLGNDIDRRLIDIYNNVFSCQTLKELSEKINVPLGTIKHTLENKYALEFLGRYRLNQIKERLKTMQTEGQKLGGIRSNQIYKTIRDDEGKRIRVRR